MTSTWLIPAGIVLLVAVILWRLVWGNLADEIGFAAFLVCVVVLVVGGGWCLLTGTMPVLLERIGIGAVVVVVVTEVWGVGSGGFRRG